MQRIYSTRSLLTFAVFAVLVSGCFRAGPMPPTSAAKFAHSAEGIGIQGSVGAAAEIGEVDGETEVGIYAPVGELSLAGGSDQYEWSVVNARSNLAYEGSFFALRSEDLKLGILHGAGFGLIAVPGDDFVLYPNAGGGLMFSASGFHAAARYWVSTDTADSGSAGQAIVHDVIATLGFKPATVPLAIELAVDRHWVSDDSSSSEAIHYVILGVTFLGDIL